VSEDRHATPVPIALFDDDETEALVEKVEELEETAFAVSVTGERTLDYDVNLLSQEDLQEGELQFDLPAASSSRSWSSARSWPGSSRCRRGRPRSPGSSRSDRTAAAPRRARTALRGEARGDRQRRDRSRA
jgi:hypothetical protein